MIDVMVMVITLLVIGVVTIWSFSPTLRRRFEAPKHAALARSRSFAEAYPSRAKGSAENQAEQAGETDE